MEKGSRFNYLVENVKKRIGRKTNDNQMTPNETIDLVAEEYIANGNISPFIEEVKIPQYYEPDIVEAENSDATLIGVRHLEDEPVMELIWEKGA